MGSPTIKRIVVAVKPFGHGATLALSRARLLAQRFGAEIAVVGCITDVGLSTGIGAGLGTEIAWGNPAMLETLERAWTERARTALEQLAEPLRDLGNRLSIKALSRSPIYEGLLQEVASRQADLLIVGVHEPTPMPHTRLTDTDWQLMRLCPCPLLLVRDPNIGAYRAVLAAVDPRRTHGEPPDLDRQIAATANALATGLASRLYLATAIPIGPDGGESTVTDSQQHALDDLVPDTTVATTTLVRGGKPAQVILDLVTEQSIDLLVMGALKRNRLKALMIGSTAEKVIADAPCDLLLVKSPTSTGAEVG